MAEAPDRIWIDNPAVDCNRYLYGEPSPADLPVQSVEYRRVTPPTPPTADDEARAQSIADLAHNLCEETMDNDATPDDEAMQGFKESVSAALAQSRADLVAKIEVKRDEHQRYYDAESDEVFRATQTAVIDCCNELIALLKTK